MTTTNTSFIEKLKFDNSGLLPAIAQDWLDGAILMMAWVNKDSLIKTIESGEVHYWSRSRKKIWHKGETSGHTQILKQIRYDCDADAILFTVQQTGSVACHTGERSCFFQEAGHEQISSKHPPMDAFSELFEVIKNRKINPEEGSYTNKLLLGGDNTILKKIGEEAAEFVMACKDDDPKSISNEAADLIFHLQVALANHGVNWKEVLKVIAGRRNSPRRG